MKLRKVVALVACLGMAVPSQSEIEAPNADAADVVISGAKVFTVNSQQPWAEAVAVKDGRIQYVGPESGLRDLVGPDTVRYDLEGRLVLPGLIDSHTHPGMVATQQQFHMLFDAEPPGQASQTKKEVLAALKAYAEDNPQLEVIHAGVFSPAAFGKNGPNKSDLDAIIPDRPALVIGDWSHSYWGNSRALELAGVDSSTPDPVPGCSHYARDPDGEPSGWMLEWVGYTALDKLVPRSVSKEIVQQFLDFLIGQGVTTIFDAGNTSHADAVYQVVSELEREGKLPVRYEASYHVYLPHQFEQAVSEVRRLQETYGGDRLRINTVKIHFDGIETLRTSAMLEPYSDAPANLGGMILDSEELKDFILELEKESINLHIHTVGDRAVRTALDAVEKARALHGGSLGIRVSLAHVGFIDDADTSRFRELDVVANLTPQWHTSTEASEANLRRLLGDRADKMMRAEPLLRDGAKVSFSSDIVMQEEIPVSSPYVGIQTGHNRQAVGEGADARILKPATERLSRELMVEGYTLSGAYQLGMEHSLGSIEVGKRADLVVLNDNLFDVDRYAIHKVQPVAVLMNGQVVHGALRPSP